MATKFSRLKSEKRSDLSPAISIPYFKASFQMKQFHDGDCFMDAKRRKLGIHHQLSFKLKISQILSGLKNQLKYIQTQNTLWSTSSTAASTSFFLDKPILEIHYFLCYLVDR